MKTPIYQVDAFTSKPFCGNPAAVCILSEEPSDSWKQSIAAEMNLSETAFIRRGNKDFSIRWFTPTIEVPLCGHATLASAHILWQEKHVPQDEPITFQSKSGILTANLEGEWICLNFPAYPVEKVAVPSGLEDALGCKVRSVYQNSQRYFLVELNSEQTVRKLSPDFNLLGQGKYGGVIVTAQSGSDSCDFVSRFFAPDFGIDEDPVTGSAHCCLCPFWTKRFGETELIGHQVSKRGGVVKVRLQGDRVAILGQAITTLKGEIVV